MTENQRNQGSVKTGNCDRPSNGDLNTGDEDQGKSVYLLLECSVTWLSYFLELM